uniref:RSE1/DDB1/CPSF1 C-terminal domain-containing protein n=1 Tax=Oryza glumipatula TaxID=40148 RepID=A0A0D9YB14_9ORYZ
MAGDPAAAAAAVGAMRPWNYVVTAHKLTAVARSCVGNFTAPDHLDLSLTVQQLSGNVPVLRLEYLLTHQGLQPMLDAPVYGRIATIELFRPCENRYVLCRSGRDASDHIGRPTNKGQTDELSRDYNTTWMTAVEMLDDYVYIGADNCYNLFTVLKRRVGRLLVIGQYHLGDLVNRFHHGPLVMQDPGSEVDQIPTFIFGESGIDSTQ